MNNSNTTRSVFVSRKCRRLDELFLSSQRVQQNEFYRALILTHTAGIRGIIFSVQCLICMRTATSQIPRSGLRCSSRCRQVA